ncbi:hypothetical protein CDD80_1742 [Ophiocordyceps camponoti-rufipedis]|uniref:Ornithine cyclodeaminase n=1 Tax=Ophiocordyceps camponoti-rufipedis TaxID=2004952 RepID=A0A2C5Z591_9HYPO|nr:hypothetical protein CDD80_1742 [Ophiocordyceps camponoti-rufipedis]
MTLTVLSDHQVHTLLEGLDLDELDQFRCVLAEALHEFSTNADADGLYQQPHRLTTRNSVSGATTLYMPVSGPEGVGCKGVVNILSPVGEPLGLVHASTLTAFRTALGSACLLNRRSQVKTITVFGSGTQAYWHVRLALMMRGSTIKHVNIINRRFSENASNILKSFTAIPLAVSEREGWSTAKFGILTPTFHEYDRLLKEQVRSADVIYCCTPSREDLFDASILTSREGRKKGRLIVAVGSYRPDMRELPEALLVQATKQHDGSRRHFHKHAEEAGVIVVDSLDGVLKEAGEIISAKINPNQIVELGELVMLNRLAVAESETSTPGSHTPSSSTEHDYFDSNKLSVSTLLGDPPRSPVSPPSQSRKASLHLPFRKSSSTSLDSERNKKEDSLARWLRDVKLANSKGIGTRIEGF